MLQKFPFFVTKIPIFCCKNSHFLLQKFPFFVTKIPIFYDPPCNLPPAKCNLPPAKYNLPPAKCNLPPAKYPCQTVVTSVPLPSIVDLGFRTLRNSSAIELLIYLTIGIIHSGIPLYLAHTGVCLP